MNFRHKACGLSVLVSLFSMNAQADAIGIGVGAYTSPFVGQKTYSALWPMINLDTGYFFIQNNSAGIHFWDNDDQQINFLVQYLPLHLNPSSDNNQQVKRLDRRHSTLLGGVSYQLRSDTGNINASLLGDLLDNSNSILVNLGYSYTFRFDHKNTMTPYLGASWTNQKHNQYYFGISQKEALRSGFNTYRPNDSFNYYAGFSYNYAFTKSWSGEVDYRYSLMRDEVKSSPIVKHGYIHYLGVGIGFNF